MPGYYTHCSAGDSAGRFTQTWRRLGVAVTELRQAGDSDRGGRRFQRRACGEYDLMEDAAVLAELLSSAETIQAALSGYVARRRPRADWVREQGRAAAKAWLLPPEVRDNALRQRGDQMLQDRHKPLTNAHNL